jgi:hypothetical protein
MKIKDYVESTAAEPEDFKSYKNPTKEQMDEVAGNSNTLKFTALPNKTIIVFPADMEHKSFLKEIGLPLNPSNTIHGVAQRTGAGYIVNKILNIKQLDKSGNFHTWAWGWLNEKGLIITGFLDKLGKDAIHYASGGSKEPVGHKEKAIIQKLPLSGEEKTSLKDWIAKHGGRN